MNFPSHIPDGSTPVNAKGKSKRGKDHRIGLRYLAFKFFKNGSIGDTVRTNKQVETDSLIILKK